jgi:LuxR family transcriptional regulator, maltose regulon positive regulatory protein
MIHERLDPYAVRESACRETAEAFVHPPGLREGLVSRAALINRLRTERAPLIVLTAPAGYGKSTLLAQWERRDPRRFAWANLRDEDDDPQAVLRLLAESLERAAVVDESVWQALEAQPVSTRLVTRRLGRSLLGNRKALVIVLDDVDELVARETRAIVRTLCDHLPPEMQLVLSGRRLPSLPLGRLRAEGRLAELSAADLRLSDREAGMVLRGAGVEVTGAELEELNARTEGWVTGTYLSALALRQRPGRAHRAAAGVGGTHHYVSEYFASEVLSRLDPDDARFATRASLLEGLAGPICDTVLEEDRSGARLRRLADAGAFLVPLDRERLAFRFHRFFRDALRVRLRQEDPAGFAALSRRAAAWFREAGEFATAIEYLRVINDDAGAAELLGATAPQVFGSGLLTEIEPFLNSLHDNRLLLEHRPAPCVAAFGHAVLGHSTVAERWAAAVVTADGGRDAPASNPWAAVLRAALCEDGISRMQKDAELASRAGEATPAAPFGAVLVGVAQLLAGDDGAAERTLVEAAELALALDAPLPAMLALAEQSLIARAHEDWGVAESLACRARNLAEVLDRPLHPMGALAFVASARSALRNSNWVRAGDDIERTHRLAPRLTEALPWLAVQVRLELARAHLALNDVASANELAAEVDRLVLARPHLGTLIESARALRREVVERLEQQSARGGSLTAAELRLLPLLTTHLTFRQIAQQLYVSRNTIKTQAISVYRKLGVSSRAEAIDRAFELGLLRPESDLVDRPA